MNADTFARLCRAEKDSLVKALCEPTNDTFVGKLIHSLALNQEQNAVLRLVLDGALTDALYTLLVALDGGASIGGVQQTYDLSDESGTRIAGGGELEVAAFEHFHGSSNG